MENVNAPPRRARRAILAARSRATRRPFPAPVVITQRPPARRAATPTRAAPPTLTQFVILSMLLHLLVVMLFGSAPGGSANRGEQLLGALDVTLRRLSPERGAGIRLSPGAETTAPGSALLERPQNAPRSVAPAAQPPAEPPPATPSPEPAAPSAAESGPSAPNAAPGLPAEAPPPVETTPPVRRRRRRSHGHSRSCRASIAARRRSSTSR